MPKTLNEALEDTAKRVPTLGFRFVPETGFGGSMSEVSFSFAAIERTTARYGGAFQALGLKKGDRVALILSQNEDFVLAFLGAIRAGIVPVPIYPPLGLGKLQSYLDNTRHIVEKSGAKALVTDTRIKRLLGTVQAACPALEQIVAVEAIRESKEMLKPADVRGDDVAFLQFTSGSTSRPKGVRLTHANLMANIDCIMRDGLQSREGDVGVSWLPLYHDMGLIGFVLAPMVYRVPVVFLPPILFLKRPLAWFEAITKHRGSIAFAPNFAYALCVKRIKERDLEGIDLSSWRIAGCGAEPIRPETLQAFADGFAGVGFRKEALLPSYGMAESSLAVSFTELGLGMKTIRVDGAQLFAEGAAIPVSADAEGAVRLVSCGKEFPHHSIRIFARDDTQSVLELPEDTVGEIRIKGPSIMQSYWDDDEQTTSSFSSGWLKTGDLGFLHDARLYVCGRTKEVIIVSGRNYYPQDMEWEAGRVLGVRKGNVVAFGTYYKPPTGEGAERERVVLVFETQASADADGVAAMIRGVRAAVQSGIGLMLDDVVAVAPGVLPKTSSGKLQRNLTREIYERGELASWPSSRDVSKLEVVKQAALSQLSYFKLAVFKGRRAPPQE